MGKGPLGLLGPPGIMNSGSPFPKPSRPPFLQLLPLPPGVTPEPPSSPLTPIEASSFTPSCSH